MHIPVLLKEAIENLNPQPNQNFVDCTIGGGGHSTAILERIKPEGKVLGIDLNKEAIEKLKDIKNLILVNDNFVNLKSIAENNNFHPINGILLDLGFSSDLLEASGRGFSFLKDEPLDMRFDVRSDLTAEKVVNQYSEEDLIKIFKEYGEEKFSRRIARQIVNEKQPIKTTAQLVEIIKRAVPSFYQHLRIHFATRIFQALRIEVNDELNNLREVLAQAEEILEPEGRIAVISFHSLEDRIVKRFFKGSEALKIITKKPIIADDYEIEKNPRSRSAKLRIAEKINFILNN